MIPEGWKIERTNKFPFKSIELTAPNGFATVIYSHDRNPENILYMLADAILVDCARTNEEEEPQ